MAIQEHIASESADARAMADELRRKGQRTPVAADEMSALPPPDSRYDEGAPRGRLLENGQEREPFGDQEQKLAWPEIPGYRLYWFNDTPGRVSRALKGGYTHVDGEDGEHVTRMVDRGERGTGVKGYLMKIPIEWYEQDQAGKNAKQAKKMDEILHGRFEEKDGQNQYVPTQGISGIHIRARRA